MSLLGDLVSTVLDRRYRTALSEDYAERTTPELINRLLSSQGEVSGHALASLILERFAAMGSVEKQAFFRFMTHDLEIDPDRVMQTLQAYQTTATRKTYRAFAAACEPARQELMRRLNQVPGGTQKLVSMRKDLLRLLPEHPDLEPLDIDFQHLFRSWFNRGFLELRPISWSSPAEVLETIIAYEAVHAIDSWDDLRRRVQPADRRCFGFFHPAMPGEPLIFVEVALTQGISNSVQTLLADGRDAILAEDADTAVFYSISNCQEGLAGISFGNSLIKQVASDLARDLPNLKNFATLSPIPNLNTWLSSENIPLNADSTAIAAYYLLHAKRRDGMPYDPVARFHLGNGAMVHAIHAGADTSENGMRAANGVMVNYLYDLSLISKNHEQFVAAKTVVASLDVQRLSASVTLAA